MTPPSNPYRPGTRDRARAAAWQRSATDAQARAARVATNRRQDRMMTLLKILGGLLLSAVVIVGIVFAIKAHAARANDCKAHGGRVTSTHSPSMYVSNGKVHQSTDTTYYCVTTDRGIIDVWG